VKNVLGHHLYIWAVQEPWINIRQLYWREIPRHYVCRSGNIHEDPPDFGHISASKSRLENLHIIVLPPMGNSFSVWGLWGGIELGSPERVSRAFELSGNVFPGSRLNGR
jgi:hypothetical protein